MTTTFGLFLSIVSSFSSANRFLTCFAAALLGFSSCGVRHGMSDLRDGDLLFVAPRVTVASGGMSEAIVSSTSSEKGSYVHVAIVDVTPQGVFVVDATPEHGVSYRPVEELVEEFTTDDGVCPCIVAKRVAGIGETLCTAALDKARSMEGKEYDFTYLPDNDSYYCSELVYDCLLTADGVHIFDTVPMNFLAPDGSLPAYWRKLFGELGMDVPQGVPGTNPQDMSEASCLFLVGEIL